MTVLLWLRFAKFLSVSALFAGTLGAVFARDLEDRQRFAYRVAGPGFGTTWLCGFLMVHHLGYPLFTEWVVGALVLSLVSLQVVLYSVGREGRRTTTVMLLAVVPFVLTLALMVWKPGGVSAD